MSNTEYTIIEGEPFDVLGEAKTDRDEIKRLRQWVADLQRGMFINCVYCGHRYGPSDEVPASMADVLKAHIEVCPEHPMSALKAENERLKTAMRAAARNDATLSDAIEREHTPQTFSFDPAAAEKAEQDARLKSDCEWQIKMDWQKDRARNAETRCVNLSMELARRTVTVQRFRSALMTVANVGSGEAQRIALEALARDEA